MKEDDRLFEADVGKSGNKWFWRARAHGLEEFCRAREPDWLPLDAAGWLNVGPYKTRWAAGRDLKDFEEEFRDFLQQEKLPGLEIKKRNKARGRSGWWWPRSTTATRPRPRSS